MPDDFFFHVRIVTAAGVAAAAIMATLFFEPVLDARFCLPYTCAPAPAEQDGRPDEGDSCEPCKPDGADESAATMIDDHSVSEDHSINIENVIIHGSVGNWCPLPPSGEMAAPDESAPDGTPSANKPSSGGAVTSDEGKGDEEGECVAGSSGVKRPLGQVYFEHDKANLSPESEKILDCIAMEIDGWPKEQPGEIALLEAYASFRGTATYNLNLAERRIKSVAGRIGANVNRAVWRFKQAIYGESHIYRSTGETSGQEGDPKNRVVRIFAYSEPCGAMGQGILPNPNP